MTIVSEGQQELQVQLPVDLALSCRCPLLL